MSVSRTIKQIVAANFHVYDEVLPQWILRAFPDAVFTNDGRCNIIPKRMAQCIRGFLEQAQEFALSWNLNDLSKLANWMIDLQLLNCAVNFPSPPMTVILTNKDCLLHKPSKSHSPSSLID
jgi:hypothetical protein